MNEQQILSTLMRNPVFKQALKDMMISDPKLARELGVGANAEPVVYVWCAEMHDVRGGVYYHPIIIPASRAMDLEAMMSVSNYSMMASENQFEAYEYEGMVNMFKMAYHRIPVRMIAVPISVFASLQSALTTLVRSVLEEAEKCFEHFENIAAMTRTNADHLKTQMLVSVFSSMTTISSCFDRDMNVCDSADHEYDIGEEENEGWDDDEEYDDEYDDEDEWDD